VSDKPLAEERKKERGIIIIIRRRNGANTISLQASFGDLIKLLK
jgi:hypothetical protein